MTDVFANLWLEAEHYFGWVGLGWVGLGCALTIRGQAARCLRCACAVLALCLRCACTGGFWVKLAKTCAGLGQAGVGIAVELTEIWGRFGLMRKNSPATRKTAPSFVGTNYLELVLGTFGVPV